MFGIIEIIGILLALTSGCFLYLYLTFRNKETKTIKTFFTLEKQKKTLIFSIVIAVLAVIVGMYGRCKNEYSAVQCYLNILVISLLAAMAWVDVKEKIISNQLIVTGMGIWIAEVLVEVLVFHTDIRAVLLFSVLGGVIWGGLLVLIALVVKTALGMGDAKMFFVLGLIYGLNNTYSILLMSLLIMALVSIVLLILKRVTRKTAVPMAPFVLIGFVLCILGGM